MSFKPDRVRQLANHHALRTRRKSRCVHDIFCDPLFQTHYRSTFLHHGRPPEGLQWIIEERVRTKRENGHRHQHVTEG